MRPAGIERPLMKATVGRLAYQPPKQRPEYTNVQRDADETLVHVAFSNDECGPAFLHNCPALLDNALTKFLSWRSRLSWRLVRRNAISATASAVKNVLLTFYRAAVAKDIAKHR